MLLINPYRFAPSEDADALAYIAAVESALGSSITGTQRTAINDFIVAEKAASRYTLLKRLYLPIWGQAAANAIDMISLTSGTFVGGVTHAAGYVQGNGTTGYFNSNLLASASGLTVASGSIFGLVKSQGVLTGNNYICGALDYDSGGGCQLYTSSGGINGSYCDTFDEWVSVYAPNKEGVILFSKQGGNRRTQIRKQAGFTTVTDASYSDIGSLPAYALYFMGLNEQGAASSFSVSQFGSYGIASGYTYAQAESFTLALKTLWEQCSGLSLP